MKDQQLTKVQRWDACEVCDIHNSPEKGRRYTREELLAHMQETHAGWALCKGCSELMTKHEYDKGKGWCELCVILCYDCMDREKYPEDV